MHWSLDAKNQCGKNAFTSSITSQSRGGMGAGSIKEIKVTPNSNAVSGKTCSFGFYSASVNELPSNWQAAPQKVVNVHIA